jgi:hypothetical protein
MNPDLALNPFADLVSRLRRSVAWIAAQFWAMLVLLLAGIAWTRLPDKHVWQVLLSLLLPLVLAAAALWLQAGTMRKLMGEEEQRTELVHGALTVLAWAAVIWVAWIILDWCDDQIPEWAGYLNSHASAHARARLFTYEHIQQWLTILVWIWRWVIVPGKVIPHAVASAQWGWRIPWRKLMRLLLNWRWWPAVIVAALVGVALPGHFFSGLPHGTVSHQVWTVIFKLAGAYLLAVICWVLVVAWATVLIGQSMGNAEHSRCELTRSPLPETGQNIGRNA